MTSSIRRHPAAISAGVLLVLAACARADDWPMWGGRPDRNMVSVEKNLPAEWGPGKGVKWTADVTHAKLQYFGNPAVAGGRVFVGTNRTSPFENDNKADLGALLCLSAADGRLLWQSPHEKLPRDSHEDEPNLGVCSTPCVADERVYYVSNRAELVCRAAKDGALVWLLDMRGKLGVTVNQASASSPLVAGGLVFVVTGQGRGFSDQQIKNPKAPSFVAVDAATGQVRWSDASPGDRIVAGSWGSPSYGIVDGKPQVAFPGGDGVLYAFEPESGKPLWSFNCRTHEKLGADGKPEQETYLVATPVYAGHRVLIATGVEPDNGANHYVGCLRAIDARQKGDVTKTAELWRVTGEKEFGVSIGNAAVHEGLVYATDLVGYANCFDLATGKRVWQHDLLASCWGSPVVADGKVYIRSGEGEGEVFVFQAGREKKLLATNKSLPGLGHGTVVAANGVLYLAGVSKIYAVASGK